MFVSTVPCQEALELALSQPRFERYLQAAQNNTENAGILYGWNANICAALMLPIHISEVVIRNAAHDALVRTYGSDWPYNSNFLHSLPDSTSGYSPRKDLTGTIFSLTQKHGQRPSTGKIIAELKFVFWVQLFTKRHDNRIWKKQIKHILPHSEHQNPVDLRKTIYSALDNTRQVRNRVAHHEPIFLRDLAQDFNFMLQLVRYRSKETAVWLAAMEEVTELLRQQPQLDSHAITAK